VESNADILAVSLVLLQRRQTVRKSFIWSTPHVLSNTSVWCVFL